MRGNSRRIAIAALLSTMASLALATPSPAAITIGSSLRSPASAVEGICPLPTSAASRSCTASQETLATGHFARGGLTAPAAGTILRWSVLSGGASPATTAVRLRLLVLDGDDATGDASRPVELPLAEPGIHSFSARLPVEKGDRLAVEARVSGSGAGPAYAPIAHLEPAVGSLDEWIYPSSPGLRLPPDATREGAELLLSAEVDTDRTPPRTKLTYANRQDFLHSRSVVVYLRSNEAVEALAAGQLEFATVPGRRGRTIYGLHAKRLEVEAGEKTPLRLRLPRTTWEAAMRATGSGRPIVVKVTVSAEDAAGNRSGTTVAAIRPSR
jgi:hypothetical protein